MSDTISLTITDLARGGQGVARAPDGIVYFVPFTLTGDQVLARILKREKRYVQTELLEIQKPAPDRQAPRCPVFTRCGGCEWQHVPYETQWQKKFEGAKSALKRAQVTPPTDWIEIPAKQIWNYRNRVQMRGDGATLGFFAKGSNELVQVDDCAISHAKINQNLKRVRDEARSRRLPPYKVEIDVRDDEVRWVFNRPHGALGFRQVHDEQNKNLVDYISKQISAGSVVYDLYGGMGNFSIPLINHAKEVHCVDVAAERPHGLTAPNLYFHKNAVLSWLLRRKPITDSPLQAVLDPPREGLGDDAKEIFTALFQQGAERVVLVGCDPDSWARDLNRALEVTRENGKGWRKAWQLMRCASLDLFPQTHHIESVAVLERMS